MILDNENQRTFLLEMMKQVSFPGSVLEVAFEVKSAIAQAQIRSANVVTTGSTGAYSGANGSAPKAPPFPSLGQPDLQRMSDDY